MSRFLPGKTCAFLTMLCGCLCGVLLAGCNGTEHHSPDTRHESGSVSFAIGWEGQADTDAIQMAVSDCDGGAVATVEASLYDAGNQNVTKGTWPCSAHGGTLEAVPAGSGYRLLIVVKDADDGVVYRGEKGEITVIADQVTDAGTIQADSFVPELVAPAQGATLTASFDFEWNAIAATMGAITYRFQVSSDNTFTATLIDDTVSSNTFTYDAGAQTLPNDTDLFWRVRSIDSLGGSGAWSPARSFSLTVSPEIHLQYGSQDIASNQASPVPLGSILVNTTKDCAFTIQNLGSAVLSLTGAPIVNIAGDSEFSIVSPPGASIAPMQSDTLDIRFAPTSTGVFSATIQIENNDSDESPYQFSIQAEATAQPQPSIAVSQGAGLISDNAGSYPFGSVVADGDAGTYFSNWVSFTIENTGSADLVVSNIVLSNMNDFDLTATLPRTVSSGSSTSFSIRFDPLTSGNKSSTVTIDNNASDDGSFTFSVTGTGNPWVPEIDVRQGATGLPDGTGVYDFNDVIADGDGKAFFSGEIEFTIENSGTAPLQIGNIYLAGSDMGDFDLYDDTTASVAPGSSTSFRLRFDPLTGGGKSATLTINSNDSDENPYTFKLVGEGRTKLFESPRTDENRFGNSVSIDRDYAVVGALTNDKYGSAAGAAYIYKRNQGGAGNWGLVAELHDLVGTQIEAFDFFGHGVWISGNYAIVGAWRGNDDVFDAGAAYIFNRNTNDNWEFQAKLTNGVKNDGFGKAVSIFDGVTDDYAMVTVMGAARVFKRSGNTWNQVANVSPTDDYFGGTMHIGYPYAVVGAAGSEGKNQGSAYVLYADRFGTDTWGVAAKLTAEDPEDNDNFGDSVSISGGSVVVGAPGDGENGAAYVFERRASISTWPLKTVLTAPDGATDDRFGTCVSIWGDYLSVSAPGDDERATNAGSVYVFFRNNGTWEFHSKYLATDGAENDNLGSGRYNFTLNAVSISADSLIVGAQADDNLQGAAYIFNYLNQP